MTNKPVSTVASASPNSDVINGLKRPLPDESVDLEEIKKIKLDEKSNDKPKDINFKSLNGKNHDHKDHLYSLNKKLNKLTGLAENNDNEHSYVSRDTLKSNDKIFVGENASNKSTNDEELNSSTKNLSQEVTENDENESINLNNVNNVSNECINNFQISIHDTVSLKNSKKEFIPNDTTISENSSELNTSLLENCVNEDFEKGSQSTVTKSEKDSNKSSFTTNSQNENSKKCKNDRIKLTESNEDEKNNIDVTDNNVNIQIVDNDLVGSNDRVKEKMVVSDNDDDCKIVEANGNNTEKSLEKDNSNDDELISAVLKGTKKVDRQTFPHLLKLFEKKEITFDVSWFFFI